MASLAARLRDTAQAAQAQEGGASYPVALAILKQALIELVTDGANVGRMDTEFPRVMLLTALATRYATASNEDQNHLTLGIRAHGEKLLSALAAFARAPEQGLKWTEDKVRQTITVSLE